MSTIERFHVVVTGAPLANAEPGRVVANLARLFRIPESKAQALLAGNAVVVKRDLDEASARKVQAALRHAGADCALRPVTEAGTGAVASRREPAAPAVAVPEAGRLETVGTIRTGGEGFTGPFEVAPVGTDLDTRPRPEAPVPDTDHLSLAEPGADLEQIKPVRDTVVPDTRHLSLED
jgi:hypothetical protein